MDTYHVVLYLHFLSLFVGVGAGATLLVALIKLHGAATLADAAPWGMLAGQVEKAFPVAILGLFGSGAYMTSDVWTWSTGWIQGSIAGLVLVALQGPLVGGRTGHRLKHALMENGPGQLSSHTRRLARHPGLWVTECTNFALVFGIVWNMTQKPSTGSAIVTLVIAYVVGFAVAYPFPALHAASETALEAA